MIAWAAAAYAEEVPADLLRLRQPLAEVHFTKLVSALPDRPPVLRGRGRSGPITAWVWPDATVARWRRATARGAFEERWYTAEGIPALTVSWAGGAAISASIASFPPVDVDLAGWTGAPVGPATVSGPGAGAPADDATWWTGPAGTLGAYWVPGQADPADPAYQAGLADGCGCILADRTTALAGTVPGIRWTLRAPHPQTPGIGELWAFPRADGVLVLTWTARETVDPSHPELAPGRVASALVAWGAP